MRLRRRGESVPGYKEGGGPVAEAAGRGELGCVTGSGGDADGSE